MEFIQFHPTTLYGTNILMTEGCRGEGGFLVNGRGERFLADYDSPRRWRSRRATSPSRNMTREILAGRGVDGKGTSTSTSGTWGRQKINARLPGHPRDRR